MKHVLKPRAALAAAACVLLRVETSAQIQHSPTLGDYNALALQSDSLLVSTAPSDIISIEFMYNQTTKQLK